MILAIAFLSQFTAHFTDKIIIGILGNGWSQLFSYMLGVLINAPCLDLLMEEFGIPEKQRKIVMLLYFACFFFGGLGCLLGWIVRPTEKEE